MLTFLLVLVDAACFWLVQHTPAATPGSNGFNYITIFLVSAPAPITLAILLTFGGLSLALLRWVWNAFGCVKPDDFVGCSTTSTSLLGLNCHQPHEGLPSRE